MLVGGLAWRDGVCFVKRPCPLPFHDTFLFMRSFGYLSLVEYTVPPYYGPPRLQGSAESKTKASVIICANGIQDRTDILTHTRMQRVLVKKRSVRILRIELSISSYQNA